MSDAVTLRPYRSSDAVALYRLDKVCFEEAFRFTLRAMRRFAEGPKAICVVAEDSGGELVGFAIAEREFDRLYLVTLDVAPSWRRAGLAGRMIGWLEGRSDAARSIALHVSAGNAVAIAFYCQAGFTAEGTEQDFYGPGVDALVFQRKIPHRYGDTKLQPKGTG